MTVISLKKRSKYGDLLAGNSYYEPYVFHSIATASGTGASGTITFSNIPQTYQHLQLRFLVRDASAGTALSPLYIEFNNDTNTANYAYHTLTGNGTAASASGGSGSALYLGDWSFNGGALANAMGVGVVDIYNYTSTSQNKTLRGFGGANNNTTSTSFKLNLGSGLWISTSAINSISIKNTSSNLATTTIIDLYGIAR